MESLHYDSVLIWHSRMINYPSPHRSLLKAEKSNPREVDGSKVEMRWFTERGHATLETPSLYEDQHRASSLHAHQVLF